MQQVAVKMIQKAQECKELLNKIALLKGSAGINTEFKFL
jgi:hypothetical protein